MKQLAKVLQPPPAGASVVSSQDHISATWVANAKGFYVGNYVHERGFDTFPQFGGQAFKITRINDATGMVEMQIPQFYPSEGQQPVTGNISLLDLLSMWRIVKFTPPIQQLTGGEVRPNSLKTSSECAQIFLALQEADTAHQEANKSQLLEASRLGDDRRVCDNSKQAGFGTSSGS